MSAYLRAHDWSVLRIANGYECVDDRFNSPVEPMEGKGIGQVNCLPHKFFLSSELGQGCDCLTPLPVTIIHECHGRYDMYSTLQCCRHGKTERRDGKRNQAHLELPKAYSIL